MAEQDVLARLMERVGKLEEGQAFAERGAAGVSEEVYAMVKRLDDVLRRLDRLEGAVRAVVERENGEEGGAGPGGCDS